MARDPDFGQRIAARAEVYGEEGRHTLVALLTATMMALEGRSEMIAEGL